MRALLEPRVNFAADCSIFGRPHVVTLSLSERSTSIQPVGIGVNLEPYGEGWAKVTLNTCIALPAYDLQTQRSVFSRRGSFGRICSDMHDILSRLSMHGCSNLGSLERLSLRHSKLGRPFLDRILCLQLAATRRQGFRPKEAMSGTRRTPETFSMALGRIMK